MGRGFARNALHLLSQRAAQWTRSSQNSKPFGPDRALRAGGMREVTQIGNQQQMELELAEMRKTIDDLRQAVALRDEKINKRELREREIALVTEQKVRDEVQKEFQSEIAKISKELKLQNAVQVEANNAIMKKLNSKIEEEQRNLAETRLKAKETIEDLARAQKTIAVHEHDKKRLEEHLQKAKQQTDKLLRESKKHLEDSEKLRLKDLARHNENANAMRAENLELKTSLRIVSDALTSAKIDLKKESALRMQTLAAHSDQNVKLQELRDFLKLVLEDNNDDYVDAILGENRLAVFFKLSMLLERIPVVK
uniref:Myosin_tail_1 domain-containing protein n=2 Tax=Panagrellus redivivus TaxID=6233 RepID=A0A7E4W9C7_PANRE